MVGEETEGGKEEEGNMSSWRDEETNEGKIELSQPMHFNGS